MKHKIRVVLFVFLNLNGVIYSQESNWNIKLSGGAVINARELIQMNSNTMQLEPPVILKESVPNFGFSLFYKLSANLQGGIYANYSTLSGAKKDILTGVVNGWTSADAIFYGLQANYQLLPLLTEDPLRFDLYATSRIGGLYKWWDGYGNISLNENFLEAGIGLGAAINFSRKFGIFGEALGGRFYYSNFNWRTGLSFKF